MVYVQLYMETSRVLSLPTFNIMSLSRLVSIYLLTVNVGTEKIGVMFIL